MKTQFSEEPAPKPTIQQILELAKIGKENAKLQNDIQLKLADMQRHGFREGMQMTLPKLFKMKNILDNYGVDICSVIAKTKKFKIIY